MPFVVGLTEFLQQDAGDLAAGMQGLCGQL